MSYQWAVIVDHGQRKAVVRLGRTENGHILVQRVDGYGQEVGAAYWIPAKTLIRRFPDPQNATRWFRDACAKDGTRNRAILGGLTK